MPTMDSVLGVSIPDNDIRIRIEAMISAVEPCTPIERAARAVGACDDIEIDGSERGEMLFGRRADWYGKQARAAIETLRASGPELAPEALSTFRRLQRGGASEIEIIEACFAAMIDAALSD
ncbi:hypothetical protein [Sphingopyxis macrogoltabida]|uniref:Uncharacterized protein n=1 Tax=Sphingopyxis macrogoltabida TaxID=33050 RepID=A0A0N9UA72_SPHMC|nr:hypothetical protein [Sphingopyxis macrogoltabida]ALH80386.1 hypothetical protein AN936_08400 [Sphingopyxis macrogoltabida]